MLPARMLAGNSLLPAIENARLVRNGGLMDGVFGKWRGLRRMAARNILRLGVTGLREHLRRLEIRALERRDRGGYTNAPPTDEALVWEAEAAWPGEWARRDVRYTNLRRRTRRGRWSCSAS